MLKRLIAQNRNAPLESGIPFSFVKLNLSSSTKDPGCSMLRYSRLRRPVDAMTRSRKSSIPDMARVTEKCFIFRDLKRTLGIDAVV